MPYSGGTFSLYSTGNPVVTGTVISSTWANNTLTDIATGLSTCVLKNGAQTITANIPMASFKITGLGSGTAATDAANLGQVQSGAHAWCGTAGGTANALTLTPTPAITAYAAGQTFRFKSGSSANSGATTVAISGLSTIAVQVNGAACVGNEIEANQWYQITVDATATACQLLKIGSAKNWETSINLARATVASHATTADIWGAAGNQIDWTGTATTTAFPAAPQAGAERTLICASTPTFTAGANMLIVGVSSGNSVTCAANDQVLVQAITTTQFLLTRLKYDGTAQVGTAPTAAQGSSLVLLSTVTASSSSSVDIETTFDSTYDAYVIKVSGFTLSALNDLYCRLKIGGSYITTSTYFYKMENDDSSSASFAAANVPVGTLTSVGMLITNAPATAATNSINADIFIHNPSSTAFSKRIHWIGNDIHDGGEVRQFKGAGANTGTAALTGVRLYPTSGTILAGVARLYGFKNS